MFGCHYKKYILNFKKPGGTSRGVLTEKESWFIFIEKNNKTGIGECSIIRGLSPDDMNLYETTLDNVCKDIKECTDEEGIEAIIDRLTDFPSIRFGVETALLDLKNGGQKILFHNSFTDEGASIPINGLIWMGDFEHMSKQVESKLSKGYNCLKLKIGAIDINKEIAIIKSIRSRFSASSLIIRTDANGAFTPDDCRVVLERLAEFEVHSIEQPIAAGQPLEMAALCEHTPLPIALDEELIGVNNEEEQIKLLETIRPQYIILKPSLLGGLAASENWIRHAENTGAGWWVTSALESNIGLNAIAQWTAGLKTTTHQGLGTGTLYTNNFESPLVTASGFLRHVPGHSWDLSNLQDSE